VPLVGVASDPLLAGADALCGTVAALSAVWRGAIELDQHGVVHIRPERALNGVQVGLMSVGRELDAVRNAVGHGAFRL